MKMESDESLESHETLVYFTLFFVELTIMKINYSVLFFILMVSTEASWWNILNLKIYATLGYIINHEMFHQEASVETIKMKKRTE